MAQTKKIILAVVFAAVLVAGFFAVKNLTGNVVKDGSKKEIELENKCECIERENIICPEGFKLMEEKRLCEKETLSCPDPEPTWNIKEECEIKVTYSPVLLSCSKYSCEGNIWEVK